MSSLDYLMAQVRKIVERAGPLPEPESAMLGFDLSLFTWEEQARLSAFIAQIEARYHTQIEPRYHSRLTSSELNEVIWWRALQRALEHGDQAASAKYRRYLATSDDELLQRFLALDESRMPNPGAPSWVGPDAPQVRKEHTIYSLSRVNYRSTRMCIERLQKGSLQGDDWDMVWMWLEQYEEEQP